MPEVPVAGTILVVDDLKGVRQVLSALLKKAGYEPIEAEDGPSALELAKANAFDAVLLDIRMPGMDGFEVLQGLKALDPDLPVIMVTGYDDVDTAVRAMHLGAYHYLGKPIHGEEVVAVLGRALEHRRLAREVRVLQQRLDQADSLPALLGTSPAIVRLGEEVARLADTPLAVLLVGERGVGKELVARAIHARSARRHGPFVAIHCGGLPPELAEGELFGHEPGAFPGADRPRPGQVELAANGTLFLADVGSLPLTAQARLLRVLQEGQVQRLGGTGRIPVDVRVIAASAPDLRELVAGHLFRRDLYTRLAERVLLIPPLRERKDDIVHLVKRFIDDTNAELGKAVKGPTPEALAVLLAYPWPGNLAELRHTLQRAVLLAADHIGPEHLALAVPPVASDAPPPVPSGAALADATLPLTERTRRAVEQLERDAIADALLRTGGNKSAAARILGIDYKTLFLKVKKYNLGCTQGATP